MLKGEVWGSLNIGNPFYNRGLSHHIAKMAYANLGREMGEVDLLVTVVITAGKKREWEFFDDEKYKRYCELLGFDEDQIFVLVRLCADYLDLGVGEEAIKRIIGE